MKERVKRLIIFARYRRRFRARDVWELEEFDEVGLNNINVYLIRLRKQDILKSWKEGRKTWWALSDKYEQHVPSIYRS